MTSIEQKAQCVLWLYETKSPINFQRAFRRCYGRKPPYTKSIKRWYEQFKETGIGRDGPTPWTPRSPDITPLDFFSFGAISRTESFPHQLLTSKN
ncbi:hypothetical protein AVEN_56186-1 [Araneus ventricosus]|uniref:DUF4817 domain-containing protein n=1 Tax=Araneus ventricosus TaxID=182803 RepID=A0A4Y2IYV6_ARAVE|nr:hypothetical protein AVEN_56186-1 [Araneus ventricosus]